jgi:hypothetical protein
VGAEGIIQKEGAELMAGCAGQDRMSG